MKLDVVQILQVGLSGLAFLLAFLSYRLFSREQSASKPRLELLRAAKSFLAICVALVVIVGAFNLSDRLLVRIDPELVTSCRRALDKLDLESRQAHDVEHLRSAIGEHSRACATLVSHISL